MSKQKVNKKENTRMNSGKTIIFVLAGLAVVAAGLLGFMSMRAQNTTQEAQGQAVANSEPASGENQTNATAQGAASEIKQGNPVVATVNGQDITRAEVLAFIQQLPENARQQPLNKLFPVAQEQLINARVVEVETAKVNLDKDPEVVKQLDQARQEIVRNTFIQRQIAERATNEKLQAAYTKYKENFPKVEERNAAHILVDSEDKAKQILAKLNKGEDFTKLAQENSSDSTASKGGDLGFFVKSDVVPEFGEAAFSTEPGKIVTKPVKSQFGYHVIKVKEARMRPVPEMASVKPLLDVQVRRAALDELVQEWKDQATVERFDINGDAIEPAAGESDKAQ